MLGYVHIIDVSFLFLSLNEFRECSFLDAVLELNWLEDFFLKQKPHI